MSDVFFSSGLIASVETTQLSTWFRHPVDGSSIIDQNFRLHWLRTSESTMELMHGGHVIDGWSGSSYVDGRPFDSFKSVLENFVSVCEKYSITPDSSLIARVRTTVKEVPALALDAAIPGSQSSYDRDRIERSIKENAEREKKGWPGRHWLRIPDGWGIKTPNEFAHERGQLSHRIPRLSEREVDTVIVWDSKRAMPRDPEDFDAIQRMLVAQFGTSSSEIVADGA